MHVHAPVKTESEDRLIKHTGSICPVCLDPIEAAVFEREGSVWMDKSCDRHGDFSALLSSDSRHYYHADKNQGSTNGTAGSCCGPLGCGPSTSTEAPGIPAGWTNHSCNLLIEITERCNLTCPTCFAGSSPRHSHSMSVAEFTRQVKALRDGGKGGSDVIQLSGGEPTVHPRLHELIDVLFEHGFMRVCINSNGIKLAQASFADRLARQFDREDAELFIYLQFDGFEEQTHQALRGRGDLLHLKEKALDNCERLGLSVHPVMTLTRGVNDHEVGDFLRIAARRPSIRNLVIQPAMYSGRYDNDKREDRLTLSDTVERVKNQFGYFTDDDFMPIPCSDPNCFGMAVALCLGDMVLPISRYFPGHDQWDEETNRDLIERFSNTINGPDAFSEALGRAIDSGLPQDLLDTLSDAEVDRLLDALEDWQNGGDARTLWDSLMVISIKPFMDAWTYDQDRIDACCVHILDPQGNPVSFCEYNAINRPRMVAERSSPFVPIEVRA